MKPTPMLRQAVAEYRAGRQEAFTTLYQESSKYLYVCIREVIGRNDNAEDIISDIMQDTYVEISKNIGQLKDEDSFLSWAGKIASNKCYKWITKNKREVLLNENDTTFENLADNDNIIPEEILQSLEKQRLVRGIIDTQLTSMQRLCIIAYYYNEQKQSEIAQELGIPENTVKTNLSRAKTKIKEGVLDIEKKQGTKLYSVAPLLLFLLGEEVSACTVPQSVTTKVSIAVSSAAKEIGKKTLWGKLVSASTKTKVIAGIVSAAAAVAVGSVIGTAVFMVTQDKEEPWEKEFREFLLADGDTVGFDLNDFEEDGIPELVLLNEDGFVNVRYCQEYENAGTVEIIDPDLDFSNGSGYAYQYNYGYDIEYDRMVIFTDVTYQEQSFTPFIYCHIYNGNMETEQPIKFASDMIQGTLVLSFCIFENGQRIILSDEEAMEYIAEAQSRFNEIKFTDITEEDINERFDEFKEDGNRRRKRNSTVEIPVQTESETTEIQETSASEPIAETEITLSDKEQEDLQVLVSMLTLNSYYFGEDMYGHHYPVSDVSAGMKIIDIIGNQCQGEPSYTQYLPPTETDDALIRHCDKDDVQLYLKNVFGIEDADISAYCEGNRAVFGMIGDYIWTDTIIDQAAMMSDGTYRIDGKFILWLATDIPEVVYPYELTVIKNDASSFGFQVISMDFGEDMTEDYEQAGQVTTGDGSLSDILLNPEGNSAYYPQGVEYGGLYFALIDIDKDGEDEIMLGTADSTDYFGKPEWMTIFNILKYERSSGTVADFDGDQVYNPLDADSWHYYDTGILMTMAEVGEGHTNFWNLLTGEFVDAALWVRDDPSKGPDSEGHSRIYNANGIEITGVEADQYYQSLKSGNEIPIIWCEVNAANIEALISGGSVTAVNIPAPYGRYKSNGGTELNFLSDTRVQVSEGGMSNVCDYTIDSMGNIVIDPANEAVEGTYNSATDELVFYARKYKKY